MYENYLKGGKIENKYGLSNISDTQKQQLEQMETKLNLLTKQMNDYTNKYGNSAYVAEEQSKTNASGLNNYLNDLNKANKHIINVSGVNTNGLQNILKDSDIVVLQKNYDYLFWSILATGTVLVSMNIVKNQ
jgi:phosphoketolase